jgi:hypothetical protein
VGENLSNFKTEETLVERVHNKSELIDGLGKLEMEPVDTLVILHFAFLE